MLIPFWGVIIHLFYIIFKLNSTKKYTFSKSVPWLFLCGLFGIVGMLLAIGIHVLLDIELGFHENNTGRETLLSFAIAYLILWIFLTPPVIFYSKYAEKFIKKKQY